MALVLRPPGSRAWLPDHLTALGRARKRTAVLAGLFAFAGVLIGAMLLTCALDAAFHLPPLARGFALAVTLAVAGVVWLRGTAAAMRLPTDPLAVALHLEDRFPKLNDSLASAVSFLGESETDEQAVSRRLRAAAVRTAEKLAEREELHRVVPVARLWRAAWLCAAVVCVAVPLAVWDTDRTAVALTRFADPFGPHPWPPKTTIEILAPRPLLHRMPKGEAFEFQFAVRGEIPAHAEVSFRIDGGGDFEESYPLVVEIDPKAQQPSPDPNRTTQSTKARQKEAVVTARIPADRLPRSFQFRIRANDGDTGWQSVAVVAPPRLVPLDGRPSPLLDVIPPTYTGLKPIDLPDGSAVIEVPAGSRIHLRAAADVPLASAFVSFTGDRSAIERGAGLSAIGFIDPLAATGSRLLADTLGQDIPIAIGPDRRTLEVTFTPPAAGTYALKFTDETGMTGTRLLEVRLVSDPAPAVALVRPAPGRDPPVLVPTAKFPVQVAAEDRIYGFRRVFLEYRVGPSGQVRTIPLVDAGLATELLPIVGGGPAIATRPQPIRYEGQFEFAVSDFLRDDGTPLREGDTLFLWAAADDWDDVTVLKEPGRSDVVQIQIVSREGAEAFVLEQLVPLRTELARARKQQRDAMEKVTEIHPRADGTLTPADRDKLLAVEQSQRQLRGKLADPRDGLRARAALLRDTVRANGLNGTPTGDRIEAVADGLERLAERDLPAIEPLLADIRQQAAQPAPTGQEKVVPKLLSKAIEHQQEVDDGLSALLDVLSQWGGADEIRGQARMLRDAILREAKFADTLPNRVPLGVPPPLLDADQRAELDRASARLDQLAERANQLIARAAKLAAEKDQAALEARARAASKEVEAAALRAQAGTKPLGSAARQELVNRADVLAAEAADLRTLADRAAAEAAALRKGLADADEAPADAEARQKALAATLGWPAVEAAPRKAGGGQILVNELRDARREIENNRPGQAAPLERSAAARLDRLADALTEKEADAVPQLAKKWKTAADQVDALAASQFDLQKRIAAASQIPDPAARAEALKELAAEQQQLIEQGKALAQRLTRERADPAAKDVREALDKMQATRDDLEQGKPPGQAPREAVEKLDDARDKLDKAGAEVPRQQTDERRRKAAAQLKTLIEEQKKVRAAADRLQQQAIQTKGWDRDVLSEYGALQDREKVLAAEVRALAESEFKDYPVFARMLEDAAVGMDRAGTRIESRKKDIIDADPGLAFDPMLEKANDERVLKPMDLSIRRLEQVLAAVDEASGPRAAAGAKKPGPNDPPMPPMPMPNAPGNDTDLVPPLAQLKALRALQAELNERTAAFDKAHPDRSKLTDEQREELKELEDTQREITALFQDVAKLFQKDEPKKDEPKKPAPQVKP